MIPLSEAIKMAFRRVLRERLAPGDPSLTVLELASVQELIKMNCAFRVEDRELQLLFKSAFPRKKERTKRPVNARLL